MTDRELYFDGATPVYLDADLVATSATLSVVKPDGTQLEAPTVTLPTASTTVAAGSTPLALVLASVTGVAVGEPLQVVSDGVTYTVIPARIESSTKTLTLVNGLPTTPDTGSTVKATRLTASVAAPGVAQIGGGFRLAWTYSDGTTTKREGLPASVVRWEWQAPVAAADVQELLVLEFGQTRSDEAATRIADRVNGKMRLAIERTGRRPWLYLSSAMFEDSARAGVRYELALQGLVLSGSVYEAQRELRFAFDDALSTVIQGLASYDSDASGDLSAAEMRPLHFSIQARR